MLAFAEFGQFPVGPPVPAPKGCHVTPGTPTIGPSPGCDVTFSVANNTGLLASHFRFAGVRAAGVVLRLT